MGPEKVFTIKGCSLIRDVHYERFHCTSTVKFLFTLQKKAIRLICSADRLGHTNVMFKDMSILKLSECVKYKTAIMMFNLFHGRYLTDSVAKEVYQIFECTFYTSK